MENENIKHKASKGVIWSFFERFSVQITQFIITIIMARLLTPSDYGLIGMLSIFMSLSQVFIDGGFTNALIQCKNRSNKDFSTVFFINITISVVIYIILFCSAKYIASFYNQSQLTGIIRVYCLTLIIYSLIAVNKTILTIRLDYKTQTKISFTAAVISGCFGIFLAKNGFGVWALVFQAITMSVLNVILSFYFVHWFPSFIFSTTSFKKLFKFGSKLLIAQIIGAIYQNMYNLVIGKKFSSASLGFYTRAESFTNLVTSNISNILTRVSFPLLSELQDDNEILIRVYAKYMSISAFIMFPLSMYLCGSAKPIILFLLGNRWAECIILLQILCFSTLWQGIVSINLNLLNVKGRSDLVLKLEIIKKSIAFLILFISIVFQNLIILCLGLVLYSFIAFYLNTIYTKKLLNYGFNKQLKEIYPYLLLSLIVLCECLLVSYFIPSSLLALICSLLISLISYFGLAKLMNLYAYLEFEALIIKSVKKLRK